MQAALALARHVGTEAVADPDLLGTAGTHTKIGDYQRVTRFMAPDAIASLQRLIRTAYKNPQAKSDAAALALAAYKLQGNGATNANRGEVALPTPDTPFRVVRMTITVDPKVTLDPHYGYYMVVSGTARSEIAAHSKSKGVSTAQIDVLTQGFVYDIGPKASVASTVSLVSWSSPKGATASAHRR